MFYSEISKVIMKNEINKSLRQYLKSCLKKSVYGVSFSQSGMNRLCQRFEVSRFELEKTIEEVRAEAAVKP